MNGEKIFVLDAEDASNIAYGYSTTAESAENKKKSGASAYGWWLRSPDTGSDGGAGYVHGGYGYFTILYVLDAAAGVSPAFNINLSSVIFSSVINPESTGTYGKKYKLTLKDSNTTITAGTLTRSFDTVTVPYEITDNDTNDGIAADTVSVLILDSSNAVKYYAPLTGTFATTGGSGTFDVPATFDAENDTVYILAEDTHEGNAAKCLTDYASAPAAITVPSTYTLVPAKAATCTASGNKEYYIKDGKYYIKDGEDFVETTLAAVTIPALGHNYVKHTIKANTCTEDGEDEYRCSRCNDSYTRKTYATGHRWKTTYTWSDDLATCTGDAVCRNDKSHTATETVNTTSEVTTQATCTKKGTTTYTATFTNDAFKTQTKELENIDALGHDFDENGVCRRCGYAPPHGPSGGSNPDNSTTTTTTVTALKPEVASSGFDVTRGIHLTLGGAEGYSLGVKIDGKYREIANIGAATEAWMKHGTDGLYYVATDGDYTAYSYDAATGKFKAVGTCKADDIGKKPAKNNVTEELIIRSVNGGKTSDDSSSAKLAVTVYYKPAVIAKISSKGVLLTYRDVPDAEKYRVFKLKDGKLKLIAETTKCAVLIKGAKAGNTYAVKALVDGEWTKVFKSDHVTAK